MTTFHIGGRQTGKTTKLVEWLRFYPEGTVIVHDQSAKRHFEVLAGQRSVHGMPNVVTPDQLQRGHAGEHGPVAIDNLDLLLPRLLHVSRIDQITSTGVLFA